MRSPTCHMRIIFKFTGLSWQQQKQRFHTHPLEWDTFKAVCERMNDATIKWLNDAYAEVLKSLDSLLTQEDYHDLWGWDTTKHGRQDRRKYSAYKGPHVPLAGIAHSTYSISARSN